MKNILTLLALLGSWPLVMGQISRFDLTGSHGVSVSDITAFVSILTNPDEYPLYGDEERFTLLCGKDSIYLPASEIDSISFDEGDGMNLALCHDTLYRHVVSDTLYVHDTVYQTFALEIRKYEYQPPVLVSDRLNETNYIPVSIPKEGIDAFITGCKASLIQLISDELGIDTDDDYWESHQLLFTTDSLPVADCLMPCICPVNVPTDSTGWVQEGAYQGRSIYRKLSARSDSILTVRDICMDGNLVVIECNSTVSVDTATVVTIENYGFTVTNDAGENLVSDMATVGNCIVLSCQSSPQGCSLRYAAGNVCKADAEPQLYTIGETDYTLYDYLCPFDCKLDNNEP